MIDRFEFHPELRALPTAHLYTRSSWFRGFFPADQQIHWFGDVRLYCTDALYEKLWKTQAPPPVLVDGGPPKNGGQLIDDWRVAVVRWLTKYDEQGNRIA